MHMDFELHSPYQPAGDQPKAIKGLLGGIEKGYENQTLLGVTGSGKTFTMANIIAKTQRPALVMAPNKTLAAQLASEFREFFPKNAVHYFVSYYDYYQPEAYIPHTDTFIEKDTAINEEIDRLRHASTQALLSRRDVLIVASVSCIYGLGSPEEYGGARIVLGMGKEYPRRALLQKLVDMQYRRNDTELTRGTFSVRGEILELFPKFADDRWYRIHFFGDEIERIDEIDQITRETVSTLPSITIFPATHYVPARDNMQQILDSIRTDMEYRVGHLKKIGKIVEAERLKQRVTFDIDMITQTGFTSGIENYSRYFDGRKEGEPPYTLIDFFPKDFLLFMDESHMTIPQLRGMYAGDRARKDVLVEYGFRLPAAKDNRPLKAEEFWERTGQRVFVSATPGPYEKENSANTVEQIVRPTGLLDPEIEIRKTAGQADHLVGCVKERVEQGQRVLVTTLTKRMAEDMAGYLQEAGIKTMHIHSDVDTMERLEILRDLRLGNYDVLVGINLLREGLDLPEVSLVAILDADKEGFLRSESALIQTMGRAARHLNGKVVMYADKITGSMQRAIDETERRRKIQTAYNKEHNITPRSTIRAVRDDRISGMKTEVPQPKSPLLAITDRQWSAMSPTQQKELLQEMRNAMELASQNLAFELAAELRDKIKKLEKARN